MGMIAAARVTTPADVDGVVATITSAFFDDPLWAPVFADVATRAELSSQFWRFNVVSAQRYPWTIATENLESVALWIPPGGDELTEQELGDLEPLLVSLVGAETADRIFVLFDQFEAARPAEPHFYLNFFATHSTHRGRGLGMGLLRENLARIDGLHAPAYLESSNPANNARYGGVGFRPVGDFVTATGEVVTTMWRDAR